MSNNLPFGNKTFVALGDFRQVAPVIRRTSAPTAVFDSSIRSSSLWTHFRVLYLTRPIRNAADPTYTEWVDRAGDGVPPLDKTVPLHHLTQIHSMNEAADYLFPDDISFPSPFNLRVDEFNSLMIDRTSATFVGVRPLPGT
jgi:PIF1-like helicase